MRTLLLPAAAALFLMLPDAACAGSLSRLIPDLELPSVRLSAFEPGESTPQPGNRLNIPGRDAPEECPGESSGTREAAEPGREADALPSGVAGEGSGEVAKPAKGRAVRWKALLPGALK